MTRKIFKVLLDDTKKIEVFKDHEVKAESTYLEDTRVRNKKSGKIYTVKKVNPALHDVVDKDDTVREPKQHSIDKVAITKSGDPVIGTHPVEFEYDDNDELVAVDKLEKELSTNLANSMSTVKRLTKAIKSIKVELKSAKDELERPGSERYLIKQKIDELESSLKAAIAKEKSAKASMHSNLAKLDSFYRDKGDK